LGFDRNKLCAVEEVKEIRSIASSTFHCALVTDHGDLYTTAIPQDKYACYFD
jgi:hypothetical protein